MTRRQLLALSAAGALPEAPVIVPVHHVLDRRAKLRPEQLRHFWSSIWPEAVRDLGQCGIRLESSMTSGEVRRSPGGQPVITALERRVINFVITDPIPTAWDSGRGLSGVTTRYHGYHLCMIALSRTHGHEIPFLSVNTCVHELLHVLLHDVFETRPSGFAGQARELRIDLYATRLWLFRDGSAIRKSAQQYVGQLVKLQADCQSASGAVPSLHDL